MRNHSPVPTCCHCGRPKEAVILLFRMNCGGEKPWICDGCVEGFHFLAKLPDDRREQVIAEHNAGLR